MIYDIYIYYIIIYIYGSIVPTSVIIIISIIPRFYIPTPWKSIFNYARVHARGSRAFQENWVSITTSRSDMPHRQGMAAGGEKLQDVMVRKWFSFLYIESH